MKIGLSILVGLLILVFLLGPSGLAFDKIDFGSYTAIEEITKESTIFLRTEKESRKIQICMERDLLCADTGKSIPNNRLSIVTAVGPININKKPLEMDIAEQSEDFIQLIFTLKVLPEDFPGEYNSNLIIKQMNQKKVIKEHYLSIELIINSWVTIEALSEKVPLNAVDYEDSVINEIPAALKISANVPWQLSGYTLLDELSHIYPKIKVIWQYETEEVYLSDDPVPLASGYKTTSGNKKYIEVYYTLKIENYRNIKAGTVRIPACFKVEGIDF